jgi:hypothetical protein
MSTNTVIAKSNDLEPCAQDISKGLSSGQSCEESEPHAKLKQLKDPLDKCSGISPAAVANEVAHDIDPELESDLEVMCMIFQASELSKPEFDSFKELVSQNNGIFDPVRRTASTVPPTISTSKRSIFSRATTMP